MSKTSAGGERGRPWPTNREMTEPIPELIVIAALGFITPGNTAEQVMTEVEGFV